MAEIIFGVLVGLAIHWLWFTARAAHAERRTALEMYHAMDGQRRLAEQQRWYYNARQYESGLGGLSDWLNAHPKPPRSEMEIKLLEYKPTP